jgi:hypothetical protein
LVGLNTIVRATLTCTQFVEHVEEADSQETLDFDDADYPQLPDNVLGLRLHRRKGILRQFMAATRRM